MFMKLFVLFFLLGSWLVAFETTNIQLLYSNDFKGNSFIYDTKDGKKTTLTFEHFRTFSYGDLYMFVDAMKGEKFNGTEQEVYTEISPRLSFSKMTGKTFSFGIIKDVFIATQLNYGEGYGAYLGGFGVDIDIPGFVSMNLNAYYKSENIESDTYQISPAYKTKDYYHVHFEGYMDLTSRDFNTHNQLLYDITSFVSSKEHIYLGTEWIYYKYNNNGSKSLTNTFQAMFKYEF